MRSKGLLKKLTAFALAFLMAVSSFAVGTNGTEVSAASTTAAVHTDSCAHGEEIEDAIKLLCAKMNSAMPKAKAAKVTTKRTTTTTKRTTTTTKRTTTTTKRTTTTTKRTTTTTRLYTNVSFNANGGYCATTLIRYTDGYIDRLPDPAPTRSGYTFAGWYTAASGGNKVSVGSTFKVSSVTVYAHWNIITTTAKPTTTTTKTPVKKIYFDAAGGSCGTPYLEYKNGIIDSLPVPTRANYNFNGWYTAKSGGSKVSVGAVYKEMSDLTLYAQWSAITTTTTTAKTTTTTKKTTTTSKTTTTTAKTTNKTTTTTAKTTAKTTTTTAKTTAKTTTTTAKSTDKTTTTTAKTTKKTTNKTTKKTTNKTTTTTASAKVTTATKPDNRTTTTTASAKVTTATNSDTSTTVCKHKYEVISEKKATCCEDGYIKTKCVLCSEKVTTWCFSKGEHVPERLFTIEKKPTCTDDGLWVKKCIDCDIVLETYDVPALGHQGSPIWSETVTCGHDGILEVRCERCNEVLSSQTVEGGHEWERHEVPSTCTDPGYSYIRCSGCALEMPNSRQITSPPLGRKHIYDLHYVVEPSCTESGIEQIKCRWCGHVKFEQEIPALGHDVNALETFTDEDNYQLLNGVVTNAHNMFLSDFVHYCEINCKRCNENYCNISFELIHENNCTNYSFCACPGSNNNRIGDPYIDGEKYFSNTYNYLVSSYATLAPLTYNQSTTNSLPDPIIPQTSGSPIKTSTTRYVNTNMEFRVVTDNEICSEIDGNKVTFTVKPYTSDSLPNDTAALVNYEIKIDGEWVPVHSEIIHLTGPRYIRFVNKGDTNIDQELFESYEGNDNAQKALLGLIGSGDIEVYDSNIGFHHLAIRRNGENSFFIGQFCPGDNYPTDMMICDVDYMNVQIHVNRVLNGNLDLPVHSMQLKVMKIHGNMKIKGVPEQPIIDVSNSIYSYSVETTDVTHERIERLLGAMVDLIPVIGQADNVIELLSDESGIAEDLIEISCEASGLNISPTETIVDVLFPSMGTQALQIKRAFYLYDECYFDKEDQEIFVMTIDCNSDFSGEVKCMFFVDNLIAADVEKEWNYSFAHSSEQ